MKTEVILTSNIVGLGAESDHVKVAAGYARNYLFPQRLAIPLTQANKRQIEALRQRRAEREAHEFNTMTELAKGVAKLICIIKVKAGEDGKMFGAVTAGVIADELKHQFDISLDKRKIHLEHPIRALGDHEVELHGTESQAQRLGLRVLAHARSDAAPARDGRDHVAAVAHVRAKTGLIRLDLVASDQGAILKAGHEGGQRHSHPQLVDLLLGAVRWKGIGIAACDGGAQDRPQLRPVLRPEAADHEAQRIGEIPGHGAYGTFACA